MKIGTSRSWTAAFISAIVLLGIAAAPAFAHHSFAMYDTTIQKTMTGRLIRFVIGANHSQYVMEVLNPDGSTVMDSNGKPVSWTIETTSAAQLVQKNITVDTFKIHTIFTITFSPLRDGRNGGAQQGAGLIMCGLKMPAGGCTEANGKRY